MATNDAVRSSVTIVENISNTGNISNTCWMNCINLREGCPVFRVRWEPCEDGACCK